jgi:hypothetical protein
MRVRGVEGGAEPRGVGGAAVPVRCFLRSARARARMSSLSPARQLRPAHHRTERKRHIPRPREPQTAQCVGPSDKVDEALNDVREIDGVRVGHRAAVVAPALRDGEPFVRQARVEQLPVLLAPRTRAARVDHDARVAGAGGAGGGRGCAEGGAGVVRARVQVCGGLGRARAVPGHAARDLAQRRRAVRLGDAGAREARAVRAAEERVQVEARLALDLGHKGIVVLAAGRGQPPFRTEKRKARRRGAPASESQRRARPATGCRSRS